MFKNLFKKTYTTINSKENTEETSVKEGAAPAEAGSVSETEAAQGTGAQEASDTGTAAEAGAGAKEKEKAPEPPKASSPQEIKDLWRRCNKCGRPILVQAVKDNDYICPECGGYFRVHAYRRIEMLIDEGTFEEWDKEMEIVNPLNFPGYEKKVTAAREKTNLNEAVVAGKGKIFGYDTVIAVCDCRFLMSSMGHNVGEKIARAVERATREELPVIIFAASGGARMQEGMISLMQMAKTSAALKRHSEADRADDRRRDGELCHAGRHYPGRAGRADWLCRAARD